MSVNGQSVPGPQEPTAAATGAATSTGTAPGKATAGGAAAAQLRKAVVVGGNRIPFARTGGAYTKSSNQDMLTAALDGLIARFGLQDERIGEVAAGAVLKHSRDFNLTREAVLGSALAAETPAYDLQQACATGLETVLGLANKIKLGQIESAIAGGVDSASDAPIAVSEGLREVLLDLNRAKTVSRKLQVLSRLRPKDLAPDAPNTGEPRTGLSMGEHQALTTAQWKITREAQDELAFNQPPKSRRRLRRGFFDDLMTPYRGLSRDSNLRADTSAGEAGHAQAGLRQEPGRRGDHDRRQFHPADRRRLRPCCSRPEEWADAHDLPKLATVVDGEAAAVDFVHGKDGLLMAPAFAVPRLLARHGLTLADFDFFEIHEAFAGTVLSTLAAWEDEEFCRTRLGLDGALGSIDRPELNVNGSSLAAGHPFAATGGRIVASLAKMLHAKGQVNGRPARGLVSICAAGGQGVVAILEAL